MADVGYAYDRERAERYLARLREEWNAVPSYASNWERWTEDDRLTFVLEWPGRIVGLSQLREWADKSRLTTQQAAALKELEGIIAIQQPTIARLLAEPTRSSRRAS